MRKHIILAILCVLAVFSFVSCRTVDHYIPMTVDISGQTATLFAQRPDNSTFSVKAEVTDFFDELHNSSAYFSAWQAWQSYAESLESAIIGIEETLKGTT